MVTNDNLGKLIAGIFRSPSTGLTTINLINTGGVSRGIRVYGNDNNIVFNLNKSGAVQIGKGTTPPTRQDFNLENAFPNSPESVLKGVTLPHGYVSGLGKITIATLISPTGGAGSITETALTQFWQNTGSNNERYLLFRDIISPVGFIIGQAINIDYEVFV